MIDPIAQLSNLRDARREYFNARNSASAPAFIRELERAEDAIDPEAIIAAFEILRARCTAAEQRLRELNHE